MCQQKRTYPENFTEEEMFYSNLIQASSAMLCLTAAPSNKQKHGVFRVFKVTALTDK